MSAISGRYLALLRHGEADRVGGSPLLGQLTADGIDQARAAARYLAVLDVSRVVCSDSARARETAGYLEGGDTCVVPALNGLRLSPVDDRPLSGLEHFVALFEGPAVRPPGGESLEDLLRRSAAAVRAATAATDRAAAVAHRIVNTVLLADALGLSLEAAVVLQQDPGAVNLLQRRPSGMFVVSVNVSPGDPLRLAAAAQRLPDTTAEVERRLYLVRHAEATNLGADHMQSGGAAALTTRGRRQGHALGRWFEPLADVTIVCSDLPRADQTAALLARGRRVAPRPALRELSLGRLDGRSFQDIFEACPDFMVDPDARLPGGETPAECAERATSELADVLAAADTRDIVVVTHGAVQRMVTARLLGLPNSVGVGLRTDWAGVTILDFAAGRWWARCLNCTPEGVGEFEHTVPLPDRPDAESRILGR